MFVQEMDIQNKLPSIPWSLLFCYCTAWIYWAPTDPLRPSTIAWHPSSVIPDIYSDGNCEFLFNLSFLFLSFHGKDMGSIIITCIIIVPVHLALCLNSILPDVSCCDVNVGIAQALSLSLALSLFVPHALRAATQIVIPTTKAWSLGEKYTKAPCYWSGSEGIPICVPPKVRKHAQIARLN